MVPKYFLPYGQVVVGVSGVAEAAIHTLCSVITNNGENPDLCCLKIDFRNASNECSHCNAYTVTFQPCLPGVNGLTIKNVSYALGTLQSSLLIECNRVTL